SLLSHLQEAGFLASFLPLPYQRGKGTPLLEFMPVKGNKLVLARKSQEVIRESGSLLSELDSQKNTSQKKKEKIGRVLLSGLSFFSENSWIDCLEDQAKEEVGELVSRLQLLIKQVSV